MVTSGSIAQNKVITQYLSLLRPKHWIKNAFIFLPLFFSGEIFNVEKLLSCFAGFIAFSFIASAVYILNDYMDIEADKKHPVKCSRPLASGAVSKKAGHYFISYLCGAWHCSSGIGKAEILICIDAVFCNESWLFTWLEEYFCIGYCFSSHGFCFKN
jgi:heme O synthase-like polyprenyltransferase